MAKVISELPHTVRKASYPWDEWMDGQIWLLTPGEDFTASPTSFRIMAYQEAAKRGHKVHVHVTGDAIVLQAHGLSD